MNKVAPFEFPPHFNYPPFFTLQIIQNTRQKQINSWLELILSYSRQQRLFEIDVNEASTKSPLFHNDKINRKLTPEAIRELLEALVSQGNAEWLDREKNRVLLMWCKPEEWAAQLYKWVCDNGQTDTVMTVWELQNSDEYKHEEWFALNTKVLMKALACLQKQKKAEVFSSSGDENLGVKFFTV